MKVILGLTLSLMATALLAQDRPSPREQAFSSRILTEVNANLTCTTELIALQERLAKAEAELKKLQEAPRP